MLDDFQHVYLAGLRQKKKLWERDYFDSNGILRMDMILRLRIHGEKVDPQELAKHNTITVNRKISIYPPEPLDIYLPRLTTNNIAQNVSVSVQPLLEPPEIKKGESAGDRKPWQPF